MAKKLPKMAKNGQKRPPIKKTIWPAKRARNAGLKNGLTFHFSQKIKAVLINMYTGHYQFAPFQQG